MNQIVVGKCHDHINDLGLWYKLVVLNLILVKILVDSWQKST